MSKQTNKTESRLLTPGGLLCTTIKGSTMKYFVLHVAVPNPLNPEQVDWKLPPYETLFDETQIDAAIRRAFEYGATGIQVRELAEKPDVTVFCIDHWERHKRGGTNE